MPPSPATDEPVRPRFGIAHVLYATSVIAASLATLGTPGLWLAALVLVVWGGIYWSRCRPRTVESLCAWLAVGVLVWQVLIGPHDDEEGPAS